MTTPRRTFLAIALGALAIGVSFCATTPARAQGTVALYVFSPKPIAPGGTLAAGSSVNVTVTAEDDTGAAVPGAIIYLKFFSGGGSAAVNTTTLNSRAQPFTADASGVVAITYVTAPTVPSSTHDKIAAQDAASAPAITAYDEYSYSTVAEISMRPKPIAPTSTLAGGATVTIKLIAFTGTGAVAPHAVVYLSFTPAAGGGSASARRDAVGTTPRRFTTNAQGVLFVVYRVPATPPSSGTDVLKATNAASHALVIATDTYTY